MTNTRDLNHKIFSDFTFCELHTSLLSFLSFNVHPTKKLEVGERGRARDHYTGRKIKQKNVGGWSQLVEKVIRRFYSLEPPNR